MGSALELELVLLGMKYEHGVFLAVAVVFFPDWSGGQLLQTKKVLEAGLLLV